MDFLKNFHIIITRKMNLSPHPAPGVVVDNRPVANASCSMSEKAARAPISKFRTHTRRRKQQCSYN